MVPWGENEQLTVKVIGHFHIVITRLDQRAEKRNGLELLLFHWIQMRENKHSNVCLKTLVNNNHDILDGETSPTQVLRMQSSTSSLTYFSLGFNQKNKHMNLRNNLAFITWSSATHRRGNWGISIRDVRGRNRRAYRLWKARFFAGYTDSSIRATYPSTGVHITVTRSSSSKRFRQNERLYSPNAQ